MVEKGIGEKQDERSTKCLRKLWGKGGCLRKLLPGEVQKSRKEWGGGGGTKDDPGLLSYLTEVYEEFCEDSEKSLYSSERSTMLPWAISMFSSEMATWESNECITQPIVLKPFTAAWEYWGCPS